MTTLIAWAAIDERRTSAVYMASDSRLSWEKYDAWDCGRKIFASEKYPEILGYTGDALFCTQILSQLTSFIDSCAPLAQMSRLEEKYDYVGELLDRAFSTYPSQFCLPNFSILYLTRLAQNWGACTFAWNIESGWQPRIAHKIPMNWAEAKAGSKFKWDHAKAVVFVRDGSGGESFWDYYTSSAWYKTMDLYSRGIYGAFADFIASGKDSKTGGQPQIAGLYPTLAAKMIGVTDGTSRSLYGIVVSPSDYPSNVRWVNRTFENCDPLSGGRIPGEQRQPAPITKATG